MAENPRTGGSGGGTSLDINDRVSGKINRIVESFERLIATSERLNQSVASASNRMAGQADVLVGANSQIVSSVESTQAQVMAGMEQMVESVGTLNNADLDNVGAEMTGLTADSETLKQATSNVNSLTDATARMNEILGKVQNTSIQAPMVFDQNPLGFETMSSKLAKMSETLSKIKTDVELTPVFETIGSLDDIEVNVNANFSEDIIPELAPIDVNVNPVFEELSPDLQDLQVNVIPNFSDTLPDFQAFEVAVEPVIEELLPDFKTFEVLVEPVLDGQLPDLQAFEVEVIPNFENTIDYDLEPIQLPVVPDLPEWTITPPEEIRVPLLFDESGLENFAPPEFETVPLELEWLPIEQPEVFLTDGLTRYQQEMASANSLLERTSQSQSNLNALARELKASPSIQSDFQAIQNRINDVQQAIARIEPIDGVVSPAVNNQLESLRGSLQSLLRTQDEVANGLSDMNTEAAHSAYNRLNTQVGQIERQIRDNTAAQNQFNSAVDGGSDSTGRLLSTLRNVAVAVGAQQAVSAVVGLSDAYSQSLARLDLMNDGLQTTAELQDMVFASAQRSRMEYQATADMVGKLGTLASDAFSGSGEIVQFAELINKQFTIAGTSMQEASGATLQLTQALASGVLRGDELNSVMEQAPTIIQSIADYLGVTKGEIREIAMEGELTADIVKNAMFAAADDINAKFDSMPKTWAQVWTGFKNSALEAFEPILQRINDIANSQAIAQFVNVAVQSMYVLSAITVGIMDVIGATFSFIASQWAWLGPVLMTMGALLLVNYGHILLVRGASLAAAAAQAVWNFAVAIYQAMTSSALVLTISLIVLVIGAIFAAAGAWNLFTGQTVSGLGIVMGVIYVLWDLILNVGIAIVNIMLGAIQFVVNLFQAGLYAVQLLWFGLKMAVALVAFGIVFLVQSAVNASGQAWVEGVYNWQMLWYGFKLFVGEMLAGMLDGISSFINGAVNGFNSLKYEADKVWYNIASAAGNMAVAIAQGIDGMINSVIGGIENMLNSVLSGINDMISALDKIPGVSIGPIGQVSLGRSNYTGGVKNFVSGLTAPAPVSRANQSNIQLGDSLRAAMEGMKVPELKDWNKIDLTSGLQDWILGQEAPKAPEQWQPEYMDFKDMSGSYDRGYAQGDKWQNQIGQMLDDFQNGSFGGDVGDLFADVPFPEVPGPPEVGGGGGGSNPSGGKLDSIGEIEDDITMDEETLNLIRDVAKQKWQQNFITMTPQVTTNVENINTEKEYEDFIAQFNDDIIDAIHDGVDGIPT